LIFSEAKEAKDYKINKYWQEPKGTEISYAGPDHLISGQHTVVASGKADVWTRTAQKGAHGLLLKPLNSPR
jgi:hypothetical protein